MMEEFSLQGHEFVPLCDLMKLTGLCTSGGQAKLWIADGQVSVDGQVELRKRCKVRPGQVVAFSGQQIVVVA